MAFLLLNLGIRGRATTPSKSTTATRTDSTTARTPIASRSSPMFPTAPGGTGAGSSLPFSAHNHAPPRGVSQRCLAGRRAGTQDDAEHNRLTEGHGQGQPEASTLPVDWLRGGASRRRDCHAAAPPLPLVGISIGMKRGCKMTVSPMARRGRARTISRCSEMARPC